MENYSFYLDQKHTIWYRNTFSIEAESLEDAKLKVLQICNENVDALPTDEWNLLHDTCTYLSPEDNYGEATEELYDNQSHEIIWTNKPIN